MWSFTWRPSSIVRESYRIPVDTYAVNVMGTVNLLEAVRSCGTVRAVVNVTTDKCYENREWAWGYRENEALGGHDPYASSKACSELVTSAYRRSFFTAQAGSPRGNLHRLGPGRERHRRRRLRRGSPSSRLRPGGPCA